MESTTLPSAVPVEGDSFVKGAMTDQLILVPTSWEGREGLGGEGRGGEGDNVDMDTL